MRWPSAWLVASSVVLIAGCGGSSARPKPPPAPRIPSAVARQLAADADAIAASTGCSMHDAAQKLLRDVIASVNDGRIPRRYQEPITSAANSLATRVPACVPRPRGDEGKHHKHGRGHDHGHGGHEGRD
jgi:hypothetical protein